jgi:hypothetical protein
MSQVATSIGPRVDVGTGVRFTTDARRWLQLALAAIWLFDGLLQFQTFMFSKDFAKQILAPTAQGNPTWIADSILWTARLVEAHPVPLDAAFAILQLAIGLALAWRRSLRVGLVVSIIWALIVWWFGEGLGGLLTGGASPLAGAPGAVLLYVVLAVLLWPTGASTSGSFVASRPLGATTAKVVWLILWGGLAALNLQPANLAPDAVHAMVAGMSSGQPGWLADTMHAFAALSAHNGTWLTIIGTVILFAVALGVFLPPPWLRITVIVALIVAAFIWVVGEALGGVFGGQGTDVNSGPLLAVIALAYWPSAGSSIGDEPTTTIAGEKA